MSPTSCEEKLHESAEAANCAFVADSRQINTHHAALQSSETVPVQQKLGACRHLMDEEEENILALQDGSVSGADQQDREVDMFEDFSGLKRKTEMASTAYQAAYHPPHQPHASTGPSELDRMPRNPTPVEGRHMESAPETPPLNHDDVETLSRQRKGLGKGHVKGPGKIPDLPVKTPKSKGTNAELALSKAREAIAKYEDMFSDTKLWDGKVRARQVDTMSNALNRHASQIMCLNSQDPDDIALATRCSEFADTVAEKVKFLQDVRQAPEHSAGAITESHYACAKTMSIQVLSNVIVWVAGQLLKDFDQDLLFVD